MAGARFEMDWGGLGRLIGSALASVNSLQELADSIGETLVASTLERFEKGVGPDGTAWKPSQRALKEGGQTLVDTADLKKSIGYEASPALVVVGTAKKYALIHQMGGQAGRGKKVTLTARPYLGFSEADVKEVRELMVRHMRRALGA